MCQSCSKTQPTKSSLLDRRPLTPVHPYHPPMTMPSPSSLPSLLHRLWSPQLRSKPDLAPPISYQAQNTNSSSDQRPSPDGPRSNRLTPPTIPPFRAQQPNSASYQWQSRWTCTPTLEGQGRGENAGSDVMRMMRRSLLVVRWVRRMRIFRRFLGFSGMCDLKSCWICGGRLGRDRFGCR